jgi:hypothetical protein
MNKEITTNQKPYDQINVEGMATDVVALVRALIPFAEMDRPGAIERTGHGSDDELHNALEGIALQRGHGPDHTLLTNADFRNAAKVLFDLTGAVPEAYWSYGIKFER